MNPIPEKPFFYATLILIALLLLTGGFLSFRHHGGVVFPDELEYNTLADNLVKYRMFTWDGTTPTASRPPGIIVWIALWKSLGVGWSGLVWINSLLVTAAMWVLTKAWFPREKLWQGRAVVFGLLFCYPIYHYVLSTLYPQAFCLALIAFSLALLLGKGTWWRAVLAGLLMGWCTLAAPLYLTWAGVLALVPIFQKRLAGLVTAAIFGVAFTAVIASWGARNVAVMGKFVPFSTNSGYNLLIGNCENTRPNAGLNIDTFQYRVAAYGMSETEADAFFSASAKKWVVENPSDAASMYFQKLVNYFNFRNELVIKSAGSTQRDILMFVTYYGLLALLVARFIFWRFAGVPQWKEWLVLVGYAACAMFASIVVTRIRYRIPCDVLALFVIAPFLMAIAEEVLRQLLGRKRKPASPIDY